MGPDTLLEYENQMFLDALHDDGLLITAKGLGVERIFLAFLKLYSDPGNLVLVLNTSTSDEDYFMDQLEKSGTKPLPRVITNEFNASEREALYMEGGVLFVTSRILVVDMLTEKTPINLVSGILVFKAHKIIDSCQEAFILRLYRQKNKTGFVKAFSDNPQSFTAGFCHVERVMKSLFVRKLFLWPRFHASVVACFEKHKVDVVEIQLEMTSQMSACQTALLELIHACVKELKKRNPTLDTDELTVEQALGRGLDAIVHLHLDPVWHQLGPVTRQLVSDIKTLRLLLQCLTQYDCVNFFNLAQSLRTNEKTFGSNSGWLFMDAAESLFVHAKERLFKTKEKKQTRSTTAAKSEPDIQLEECPKWSSLREVLDEIHGYMEEEGEGGDSALTDSSRRVIVAASDDRTCNQLREYLTEGGQSMLERLYNKKAAMKAAEPKKDNVRGHRVGKRGEDQPSLTQMMADPSEVTSSPECSYYTAMTTPITLLHPLHSNPDPCSFLRTLQQLTPRYVVLYDPHITVVRQLEVYRACHPSVPLRVYFLMYAGSAEEQVYLTSLRQEKEAFHYLIRQKAMMVIPEEREGRTEDDVSLERGDTAANQTVNTRKGGQATSTPTKHKVIVDMREFRSELPSLIHRRGIDVEPVTLEVGDYILTPDICVERKSVSDLIGSLNNGRLYNQAVAMCRYYTRPILLIEFDANKSFALQGQYSLPSELHSSDTTSRLTLLTLHFPRLRVLWCQSPYATAQTFHALKEGRAQPDATAAMSIKSEQDEGVATGQYSHAPQNVLLKMPGVTTKNVYSIMRRVESLAELATLSLDQLTDILSSAHHARLLHSFLHSPPPTTAPTNKRQNTRKPNFKHVKRHK